MRRLKRPFAVIGFSMLATFLIISNLTFNQTVAVILAATVLFCLFLIFKRKYKFVLTVLLSVAVFSMSFVFAQNKYVTNSNGDIHKEIKGIVCQIPTNSEYPNTYIVRFIVKTIKSVMFQNITGVSNKAT